MAKKKTVKTKKVDPKVELKPSEADKLKILIRDLVKSIDYQFEMLDKFQVPEHKLFIDAEVLKRARKV